MLSSDDVSNHWSEYGDVQLSCPAYITRGIHDPPNEKVLHQICALLNSVGGIIVMKNVDIEKNVLPKHLDSWWSGMESNIANMLSRDDLCNFVDLVGTFNDAFFYIFVKSAEHLCTVDYHCRLPTDTATHEVSYRSAVKLCGQQGMCRPLALLPSIPTHFRYGITEETLKQEGKQIQFKLVTSRQENMGKPLSQKVSFYSTKYISAFANHEGGHVYFGIEDTTAGVYGEELSTEEETRIVHTLSAKMNSMIWGDTGFAVFRGVHWDIHFLPIAGCPQNERRRVIVVSVCKMYGGVFTACPESYRVSRKIGMHQKQFSIRKLEFDEWKSLLLKQSEDCPSLHSRFMKIPLLTPQCRLVFSLPHSLQAARRKVIKLSTGLNLHPKNILQSFNNQNLKQAVTHLLGTFTEEEHLVIALNSWGLSLPYPPHTKPSNLLLCLAVFSCVYGLHVISFVNQGVYEESAWRYTWDMAINLKECLNMHGGCNNHIGIRMHVLDITSKIMVEMFQGAINVDIYPQTYCVSEQKMDQILNALTIAIASYKPFGKDEESSHYFLLTCDQLELLWSHQFTKELWVHGPPGAGKTVTALQMMEEFHRRGCTKDQILYVAENHLICSYVSSFDVCLVVSRRKLMADASNPDLFNSKYRQIRNVVVDEAQNFKSRDGDWYSLLETLSNQNVDDQTDITVGYFWLFMDYARKVHKFEAGLPGLIGKNNFMLSEISRNSKEIFEYASKFMDKSSCEGTENTDGKGSIDKAMKVEPNLGHQFSSGHGVSVLKCEKSSVHHVLFEVLQKFSQDGVEFSDMAILVSKKKESNEIQNFIKKSNLFEGMQREAATNSMCLNVQGSPSNHGADLSVHNIIDPSTISSQGLPTTDLNDPAVNLSPECSIHVTDKNSNSTTSMIDQPSTSIPITGTIADANSSLPKSHPVLVSTVRDFSGLDKSVIVGMDPHANPDHADLEKLILNMATRAKDWLVILTTSDDILQMLKT